MAWGYRSGGGAKGTGILPGMTYLDLVVLEGFIQISNFVKLCFLSMCRYYKLIIYQKQLEK